jgi:hypothetical protein
MLPRDPMEVLRHRIAVQEDLAGNAAVKSDRVIHAELAAHYRAELEALKKKTGQRFAGFS